MSVNHTHGRFAASSTTGSVFGSAATAQNDDAAAANGGTGAGADAGGDAGGDDTPTVMEIVAEFKKQKISGTVTDKRALLKKVVNCRDVLVKKLAEYRSPEVADAFRKSTWDEAEIQKQKHKADDLSKQLIMIAQILEVCAMFMFVVLYMPISLHRHRTRHRLTAPISLSLSPDHQGPLRNQRNAHEPRARTRSQEGLGQDCPDVCRCEECCSTCEGLESSCR